MKALGLCFNKMSFLGLVCSALFACNPSAKSFNQKRVFLPDLIHPSFAFSVASGDPGTDHVFVWTKITDSTTTADSLAIKLEFAADHRFSQNLMQNTHFAQKSNAYSLTQKVDNLNPNSVWYYRFIYNNDTSAVGRTFTMPVDSSALNLAFVSCSNYEWGYFNAYANILKDSNIQAVVHLGDYIYEYAPGGYGDTTIGRKVVPANEIVSLEDYRTRYALYRNDKDLRRLHQHFPMIAIWDDHESANNSYLEGAQNHQAEKEGSWADRKAAAIKAYYEWMPFPRYNTKHYRHFQWGPNQLIALDTRLEGRSVQAKSGQDSIYHLINRTILGEAQKKWFKTVLQKEVNWNIIANQVPFSRLYQNNTDTTTLYMDGWDGYPTERAELIGFMHEHNSGKHIWLTGDYHSSFALYADENGTEERSDDIGIEFIVPSVNSANYGEYIDSTRLDLITEAHLKSNPHMLHADLDGHGWVKITVNTTAIKAVYHYCKNPRQASAEGNHQIGFVYQK